MITFDRSINQKSLEAFKKKTELRNNSDQKNVMILKEWKRALQKDLRLVHTISARGGLSSGGKEDWKKSPFYDGYRNVETLFSTWDVISTSCVSFNDHGIYGGVALEIALVLDVPYQNILGTHLRDVWFDNFAGLEGGRPGGKVIDKAALSRNILTGTAKFSGTNGFKMNKPYNTLLHPNSFRNSIPHSRQYNEVLVIGRSGLFMYPTIPGTEKIKISGIVYNPSYIKMSSSYMNILSLSTREKMAEDLMFLKNIMTLNNIREVYFPFVFSKQIKACGMVDILKNLHFDWISGTKFKLRY